MDSYSHPSSQWRSTMEDGELSFHTVAPALAEQEQSKLKDKDDSKSSKFELADKNVILKFGKDERFSREQMIYDAESKSFGKVTAVEEGKDGKLVSLTVIVSGKEKTYKGTDTSKISTGVTIKVRATEKGSGVNLIVEIKCGGKVMDAVLNGLKSVGYNISGFKLYSGKQEIEKGTILKEGVLNHESVVLAIKGLGAPKKWRRFEKHYEHSTWSNSGRYGDALTFIPQKAILFAGFATWSTPDNDSYEMKYEIELEGDKVFEQPVMKCTGWQDQYYFRTYLEEPIEVPAMAKLVIRVWIAKSIESGDYISTHYGDDGNSYADIPNEDMGLFKLDSASGSDNGTSVYSGNLPEIFYHLN